MLNFRASGMCSVGKDFATVWKFISTFLHRWLYMVFSFSSSDGPSDADSKKTLGVPQQEHLQFVSWNTKLMFFTISKDS